MHIKINQHKIDLITVILLSIILIIGSINFYYSRKIDKKYTDLLKQSISASNATNNIVRNSYLSLLRLQDIVYNASSEKGAGRPLTEFSNQYQLRNEVHFKTLDSIADIMSNREEFNKLQQARFKYRSSKDSLIALVEKGDLEFSRNYYLKFVKPDMDNYQKEQTVFAEQIRMSTLRNSDELTELTANVNAATATLVVLPIISMILIFLVIMRLLVKLDNTWN